MPNRESFQIHIIDEFPFRSKGCCVVEWNHHIGSGIVDKRLSKSRVISSWVRMSSADMIDETGQNLQFDCNYQMYNRFLLLQSHLCWGIRLESIPKSWICPPLAWHYHTRPYQLVHLGYPHEADQQHWMLDRASKYWIRYCWARRNCWHRMNGRRPLRLGRSGSAEVSMSM